MGMAFLFLFIFTVHEAFNPPALFLDSSESKSNLIFTHLISLSYQ